MKNHIATLSVGLAAGVMFWAVPANAQMMSGSMGGGSASYYNSNPTGGYNYPRRLMGTQVRTATKAPPTTQHFPTSKATATRAGISKITSTRRRTIIETTTIPILLDMVTSP